MEKPASTTTPRRPENQAAAPTRFNETRKLIRAFYEILAGRDKNERAASRMKKSILRIA